MKLGFPLPRPACYLFVFSIIHWHIQWTFIECVLFIWYLWHLCLSRGSSFTTLFWISISPRWVCSRPYYTTGRCEPLWQVHPNCLVLWLWKSSELQSSHSQIQEGLFVVNLFWKFVFIYWKVTERDWHSIPNVYNSQDWGSLNLEAEELKYPAQLAWTQLLDPPGTCVSRKMGWGTRVGMQDAGISTTIHSHFWV